MRNIPSPHYLGTLNHQPYHGGVFWANENNQYISGPFANQDEMNRGILERMHRAKYPQYVWLVQKMVDNTLRDHRTVFTHGDLQPKNIMVEQVQSHSQSHSGDMEELRFKITLIDWEIACWYPEYCEFCNAWLELVLDILDGYPVEYLMMQAVYNTVFY